MAQFPDVYCWIKLIHQPTGKAISGENIIFTPPGGSIIIRYVVANDSDKPTGNFMVSGTLKRNGANLPLPIPLTTINLQPKTVWKHEHVVNKDAQGLYKASLLGDVHFVGVGGLEEEDEKNNRAEANFQVMEHIQ